MSAASAFVAKASLTHTWRKAGWVDRGPCWDCARHSQCPSARSVACAADADIMVAATATAVRNVFMRNSLVNRTETEGGRVPVNRQTVQPRIAGGCNSGLTLRPSIGAASLTVNSGRHRTRTASASTAGVTAAGAAHPIFAMHSNVIPSHGAPGSGADWGCSIPIISAQSALMLATSDDSISTCVAGTAAKTISWPNKPTTAPIRRTRDNQRGTSHV